MKFNIDDCHIQNSHGDYLDIKLNHLEKYITVKTETTGEFSLESELEIDILCQTLKKMFQAVNGGNTTEVDHRIPGVGC